MSTWLNSVVSKLSGILVSKPPSAHVCVFGKHPGWNDHIDDFGLDSEALVAVKEALYVHGIGGVIDSGKWENPPPDDRVLSFRHVFLWKDAANLVFGRMWDSRDGKGRSKYPMVVCVHLSNRTTPGIPNAFPLLEEIEAACKQAATADEVHAIIVGARPRAAGLLDAPPSRTGSRAEFADIIGLTADSDATLRLAYATESYLGWMRSVPTAAIERKLAQSKMQPQHIRVPSDVDQPGQALAFWQGYFSGYLPEGIPQFYLCSLDAPWLDLIAGPLTPRHLGCIRSGEKSVPPVQSIPFEISEADRTAARAKWTTFLGA